MAESDVQRSMYCARTRSTLIHTDIRMRMEHKQKLVAAIQRQSKPAASKQAGSAVKANTPRQVVRRSISQLTEPRHPNTWVHDMLYTGLLYSI